MRKSRRKSKTKLNKYFIRRMVALLILIILLLILKSVISGIVRMDLNAPLTVLIDNEVYKPKKMVIVDDVNNIYFSMEDIKDLYDEFIDYDEDTKQLITTFNKHTAMLKLDESSINVNDTNIITSGTLKEIENTIYLPLKDMQIVYDIELEYEKLTNRVVIDSTYKAKDVATLNKKTKVYNKKGFFGHAIEKLLQNSEVVVIANQGKYSKIRTENGQIGFIKTKKLSEPQQIRADYKDDVYSLVIYNQYSAITGIYENIRVEPDKLNAVSPTFFYLEKDSKVEDRSNSKTASYSNYVEWTKTNNLSIIPTFTNNESVSKTLDIFEKRNKVINELNAYCTKYQYRGININFSTIDDIKSFYRFVIEIVPRFKESGLIVSVTLKDSLDKDKIQKITDYTVNAN